MTDGYTYAKMFNESFFNFEGTFPQNVNKTQTFSQQYLDGVRAALEGPEPADGRRSTPNGQYVYYASTDWYGLLYKDQHAHGGAEPLGLAEHRQGELPDLRPLSRPARPASATAPTTTGC